jgi:hypothetical protein
MRNDTEVSHWVDACVEAAHGLHNTVYVTVGCNTRMMLKERRIYRARKRRINKILSKVHQVIWGPPWVTQPNKVVVRLQKFNSTVVRVHPRSTVRPWAHQRSNQIHVFMHLIFFSHAII